MAIFNIVVFFFPLPVYIGGPVVKTLYFHCRGVSSITGWETKIPGAAQPGQKNLAFPCGSADKESSCNEGDLGLIPELGQSSGEGKGYPLQYCGLENSIVCKVHGVAKSPTRMNDLHFHFSICIYIITYMKVT